MEVNLYSGFAYNIDDNRSLSKAGKILAECLNDKFYEMYEDRFQKDGMFLIKANIILIMNQFTFDRFNNEKEILESAVEETLRNKLNRIKIGQNYEVSCKCFKPYETERSKWTYTFNKFYRINKEIWDSNIKKVMNFLEEREKEIDVNVELNIVMYKNT